MSNNHINEAGKTQAMIAISPIKILVLDNYDSFTYNLVHLIEHLNHQAPDVYTNDALTPEDAEHYDAIVLSPGPGIPSEAGNMMLFLEHFAHRKPILGVCLGHQAITTFFGGEIYNAETVYHGIETPVYHDGKAGLFQGVPSPFMAGRYHSWMAREASLPACLNITARDAAGNIMAVQHTELNIHGVQFHPESIMTPHGEIIVSNWLKQVQ